LAAEEATSAPTQFVQHVHEMLAHGASARAGRYIARHPDTALAALRGATSADASTPAVQLIAQVYDRDCQGHWTPLLADRVAHPHKYARYEQQRATVAAHLRQGQGQAALALALARDVPRAAPNAALLLDAVQMTATAALLCDQPKAALAALTPVAAHAAACPHQAAYWLLLQSEAHRRLHDGAAADASWDHAVQLANGLLRQPSTDPTLWDRCAYLRPVESDWPAPVCVQLAQHTGLPDTGVQVASHSPGAAVGKPGESQVWACIGMARLQRGEPELALAALKQAETWAPVGPNRSRLQLAQAQALLDLDQPGPATATLVPLAKEPATAGPALALLGALRLQQKSVAEALPLLKKAVEDHRDHWPGRTQAEANLGLVLLITGDEANGRRWLHTAQEHFAAEGAIEQLRQALLNEMNYLAKVGQTEAAAALRSRAEQLPAAP
jgi:tetratricopeptide (TPR) repeat protein